MDLYLADRFVASLHPIEVIDPYRIIIVMPIVLQGGVE
jgi:hypothetical protein